MTVPLPQPIASSSRWQLFDWIDQQYTSGPAAGGIAHIELPQLASNERWQLTHMVCSCSSTSATSLRLYLGSATVPNLRDGTDSGNFNVADWPAGLMVPPSSALIAQWSGASDGATGTLTLQASIYRLSGS